MGWSAETTARTSLWRYMAALDGWRAANSPDDEGLTDSEFAELGAALDAFEAATLH